MAQLEQLDATQSARRLPLRAEIQLLDVLLADDGPGDDVQFRGSLEGLLAGEWCVEHALSEPAIRGEARRLLTFLHEKMERGS
jgi:hypothetical protein